MTRETWIIYKAISADPNTDPPNSLERKLIPSGGLTDILSESWNWKDAAPAVGDRVREFTNLENPGKGVTHGKDGDWQVTDIHEFTSPTDETRIIIAHCQYAPIQSEWEALNRITPHLDSFGGDAEAYESWLADQPEEVQQNSRHMTQVLNPELTMV
jgi:hypothetical protein